MNLFHQLRWKLTLSYMIVTVGAFLVILVILGGLFLNRIFIPENEFNPEMMLDAWMNDRVTSAYPILSQMLSSTPRDIKVIDLYLKDTRTFFSSSTLLSLGALRLSLSTNTIPEVMVFDEKGVLLGSSKDDNNPSSEEIGQVFTPGQIPGLEGPFNSALAGETNPKKMFTTIIPNQKYVVAVPVFNQNGNIEKNVVGVIVILLDAIPTQNDIPSHILEIGARSVAILLIFTAAIGAIFGTIISHGLVTRFSRLAATTDLWSEGDFSTYIKDRSGDELSQLAERLNNMAKQLQNLLLRKQEMAVSEERNRLARDLHDSAKQQALAASFELGTAITLFEQDPPGARRHLEEADHLIDSVKKELTNLVDELRPLTVENLEISEILKTYGTEWSRRSGIRLKLNIEGNDKMASPERHALFRIVQEALSNIFRHSSANYAVISLKFQPTTVMLQIRDNGVGFDIQKHHNGLGLNTMRERVEALQGTITFESKPGKGTKIKVILPNEGVKEVFYG